MATPQEIISQARKIRSDFIELHALTVDDTTAIEMPEIFPSWAEGVEYTTSIRIRYDGKLYRCVQAHTSQADWTPEATPALWTEVAAPGEIPDWKQPTGAQDAYAAGDKVKHNEKIWVSTVDNNVWEPGVYGWDEA